MIDISKAKSLDGNEFVYWDIKSKYRLYVSFSHSNVKDILKETNFKYVELWEGNDELFTLNKGFATDLTKIKDYKTLGLGDELSFYKFADPITMDNLNKLYDKLAGITTVRMNSFASKEKKATKCRACGDYCFYSEPDGFVNDNFYTCYRCGTSPYRYNKGLTEEQSQKVMDLYKVSFQ
jgi:hypothetical protein